ncbi:MAG: MEMO1 family protein [Candidatus Thermoplasmatota archaeon]
MNETRKAFAAGRFYESSPEKLKKQIKNCFLEERGPGKLPNIIKGKKNVRGVVVPHAGYIFSGAIAAHSFYEIANNGFADNFILLGPNHSGTGSAISTITKGKWETPLGEISINQSLAKKIANDIIDMDETAHQKEHSLEVQLPFLQYIADKKDFGFVPISLSLQDYKTSKEIAQIITKAIRKTDGKTIIIASSDFSHIGFNYMSMPPKDMEVDDYAEKQDKKAIKKIIDMDPKGLIETVEDQNISMCGYGPVSAMLLASKNLGSKNAELLKYGSSYEVSPGSNCVGYGAIVVY